MIERDYVMRLVKQFFDALAKLVSNRDEDTVEEIQVQLSGLYEQYLGKEMAFFYSSSVESIIDGIVAGKDLQKEGIPRMEMLAELLYQDAIMKHDATLKQNLLRKALALFDYLAANSHTFSVDREARIETIRDSLMMLDS